MTKFYNNVKSRLNKKGINGFTKADYLEAANQLEIVDLDNVTTDQIIAGVELLESKRSSQLVSAIAPTTEQLATQYQEAETFTQEETEEEEVSAIALDEGDSSDSDKRALTVQKSQELGIRLSDTEINLIADSIEQCGESLDELLDGIQSALVAYINHKTSQNTQKIDSALDAVVDYAEQKFSDNSQHLSNRLIKLGSEMEAVATRNKSQIKSILSRLTVHTDKAG